MGGPSGSLGRQGRAKFRLPMACNRAIEGRLEPTQLTGAGPRPKGGLRPPRPAYTTSDYLSQQCKAEASGTCLRRALRGLHPAATSDEGPSAAIRVIRCPSHTL